MQFSTSAALAAMAVFAGQTLAECGLGRVPGHGRSTLVPTCKPNSSMSWFCSRTQSAIARNGATWTLIPGSGLSTIWVLCGDNQTTMYCRDGALGNFNMDCGDNPVEVREIVET
ncbi:hypothetical protein E4U43_005516 [Claviceps pusilla]|uniref:Cyanovirin-N domain-containing protein n=1 Tax=Claviceps pusilla TaxID=123648 RepID=A0A9P7SWA3_9HYPO|nr:hypothetical protein E4U43_005516 [Claviceps pusilla]